MGWMEVRLAGRRYGGGDQNAANILTGGQRLFIGSWIKERAQVGEASDLQVCGVQGGACASLIGKERERQGGSGKESPDGLYAMKGIGELGRLGLG